ncbi:hypothetical protein M0R45_005777 [Rubus argutus]|uniref:Uncharacterized protein n=1 Tax=Rubus argutus TaxID=59490 RepID=A0AAW1YNX5_RUBAR
MGTIDWSRGGWAGNVGFDDGACRLIGGNPRLTSIWCCVAMLSTVVTKAVIVKLRSASWVKRFTMVIVVFVSSDIVIVE